MSDVHEYEAATGWADHVHFSGGHEGFAYRPGEVIVGGEAALADAERIMPGLVENAPELVFEDVTEGLGFGQFYRLTADVDSVGAVSELRVEGVVAQPNHVLFTHCACCCGPHPANAWAGCIAASPVHASPVHASPVHASPVHASPVHASPVHASPVHASPVHASQTQATGRRRSSAVPASAPSMAGQVRPATTENAVRIAVLDTGMAAEGLRPQALDSMAPARRHWEVPDPDGDGYLDPAAGHGTFIAGLIDLITPGCEITVEKVLSSYGDGDEVTIARRVLALAGNVDLIDLSCGGYAMEHMLVLNAAVRRARALGTIVVASAGNDASCRPTYPAALPDVVGVGAVGPAGPAPFTNYGPWVRACAPGVDIVSWFFSEFDGPEQTPYPSVDPDHFVDWARWSGTSFAAPHVVAALARHMAAFGVDAPEAVRRVIDAPSLLRIPNLGTVVNIS